jgi:hypothetical protein
MNADKENTLAASHSEALNTPVQGRRSITDEPTATGHPEPCEVSIRTYAGGYRDGFFTSFRMTGTGVHWQRSEESRWRADALARHASRGEGTPPTKTGFFAPPRMTGIENPSAFIRAIRGRLLWP